jgi:hypothetical protein
VPKAPGDYRHGKLEALEVLNDSGKPITLRWLAEGRDPSDPLDSDNGGFGKNEGDNEITGVHVSNGNPGTGGILGAQIPTLFKGGWRSFSTEQHGDNRTIEVVRTP